MAKPKVIAVDGRYWFSVPYAATLLHTVARKIEQMEWAGVLDRLEVGGVTYVPEDQVTALRRDPERLRTELKKHRMPNRPAVDTSPNQWPRSVFSDRDRQLVAPIADYRFKAPKDCG